MQDRNAQSTTDLRALQLGDGVAVAEVGTTCLVLWRAEVTEPRFHVQRAGVERICGEYPGRAAVMCVIEPGAPPPSDEMRRAASVMLKQQGHALCGLAVVIEGSGFSVSIIRTVLRSIQALMGSDDFPLRFFARPVEASAWLAALTRGSADALIKGVELLRAELPLSHTAPPAHVG